MARNKKLFFPLTLSLVAVVIAIQVGFSSTEDLNRVSSYVLYPLLVMQKRFSQPITAYVKNRRTNEELESLVSVMREKHEKLLHENIQLKSALQYGNDINELVEFKKRYHCSNAVVVQVLTKNFSEQTHFFLVDAGINKGVEKDMVVVYKNNLLGRVTEVYPWYSKVILTTDRTCKVAALCSTTRAAGLHEGQNNERGTTLNYVSHLASIQVDDLVISSGEGGVFPRGFALGKVASYSRDELLYHVAIAPLIDTRTIDYCMLLPRGFTGVSGEHGDFESYAMQEHDTYITNTLAMATRDMNTTVSAV
jgi:rod shape-determining protein MreC